MNTDLEQQYLPYITALGFEPAPHLNRFKTCGHYFTMNPAVGQGFYWFYSEENRFGIAIFDIKMHNNQPLEHGPASYLYLGKARFSGYMKHLGTGDMSFDSVYGYVGSKSQYKTTLSEGFHIHNIGLSIAECYAAEILDRNCSGSFEQLKTSINRLNHGSIVPEIAETLRQIQEFQPSEEIAGMYYKGKILELVSLVLQWEENCRRQAGKRIAESDLEHLEAVTIYLRNHFMRSVSIDDLARRACMSKSKLFNLFKQVYRSTITEYLHNLRLQRAKELLLESDLKISSIANEVGYKAHGSFSEVFKRYTSFTPNEYRQSRFRQPI